MTRPHAPDDISSLLLAFIGLIGHSLRAADGENGLSLAQLKALYSIGAAKAPTMKELADTFGITPPSVTALVNRLVKEKLVKRIMSPSDRRTIRLELTPQGKTKLAKGRALVAKKTNELTKILSGRERRELARVMQRIIEHHESQ